MSLPLGFLGVSPSGLVYGVMLTALGVYCVTLLAFLYVTVYLPLKEGEMHAR